MAESKQENKQTLRVAIVATDDFEEVEMTEPRKFLEAQGAKTVLIAPHRGEDSGFKPIDDKAGQYDVDQTLDEANSEDFDALLLPGGALNADTLRVEPEAQEFAREFDRKLKPIAVICHASLATGLGGLAKGRTLTSYHTIRDDLVNAGGNWLDSEAVVDRNWVPAAAQRYSQVQRQDQGALLGRQPRTASRSRTASK